jgi:hypothetical protein
VTSNCAFSATTEGLSFFASLTADGGFPPYSWSETTLPTWLSLNSSTGALSGVAAPGLFTFTARATDSHSQSTTQTCGIAVNPLPVVTTTWLQPGTAGAPYWQTLAAFGGTGSLTWSASSLPVWLALNPVTGVLSGTPPSSGNFNLTVRVTDSLGAVSPPATLGLLISGPGGLPMITACPLPPGTVGSAISVPLTAALGFPPYEWSVSGLPSGLSAAADGTVTGTATAPGTSTVGLTLRDAANQTVSAS